MYPSLKRSLIFYAALDNPRGRLDLSPGQRAFTYKGMRSTFHGLVSEKGTFCFSAVVRWGVEHRNRCLSAQMKISLAANLSSVKGGEENSVSPCSVAASR